MWNASIPWIASLSTDCSGATMSHHQWWCVTRSYCLQLYNCRMVNVVAILLSFCWSDSSFAPICCTLNDNHDSRGKCPKHNCVICRTTALTASWIRICPNNAFCWCEWQTCFILTRLPLLSLSTTLICSHSTISALVGQASHLPHTVTMSVDVHKFHVLYPQEFYNSTYLHPHPPIH